MVNVGAAGGGECPDDEYRVSLPPVGVGGACCNEAAGFARSPSFDPTCGAWIGAGRCVRMLNIFAFGFGRSYCDKGNDRRNLELENGILRSVFETFWAENVTHGD
jgi:hypothetical protein